MILLMWLGLVMPAVGKRLVVQFDFEAAGSRHYDACEQSCEHGWMGCNDNVRSDQNYFDAFYSTADSFLNNCDKCSSWTQDTECGVEHFAHSCSISKCTQLSSIWVNKPKHVQLPLPAVSKECMAGTGPFAGSIDSSLNICLWRDMGTVQYLGFSAYEFVMGEPTPTPPTKIKQYFKYIDKVSGGYGKTKGVTDPVEDVYKIGFERQTAYLCALQCFDFVGSERDGEGGLNTLGYNINIQTLLEVMAVIPQTPITTAPEYISDVGTQVIVPESFLRKLTAIMPIGVVRKGVWYQQDIQYALVGYGSNRTGWAHYGSSLLITGCAKADGRNKVTLTAAYDVSWRLNGKPAFMYWDPGLVKAQFYSEFKFNVTRLSHVGAALTCDILSDLGLNGYRANQEWFHTNNLVSVNLPWVEQDAKLSQAYFDRLANESHNASAKWQTPNIYDFVKGPSNSRSNPWDTLVDDNRCEEHSIVFYDENSDYGYGCLKCPYAQYLNHSYNTATVPPTCEFDCVCVHGKCNEEALIPNDVCRCYSGWYGINCNITLDLYTIDSIGDNSWEFRKHVFLPQHHVYRVEYVSKEIAGLAVIQPYYLGRLPLNTSTCYTKAYGDEVSYELAHTPENGDVNHLNYQVLWNVTGPSSFDSVDTTEHVRITLRRDTNTTTLDGVYCTPGIYPELYVTNIEVWSEVTTTTTTTTTTSSTTSSSTTTSTSSFVATPITFTPDPTTPIPQFPTETWPRSRIVTHSEFSIYTNPDYKCDCTASEAVAGVVGCLIPLLAAAWVYLMHREVIRVRAFLDTLAIGLCVCGLIVQLCYSGCYRDANHMHSPGDPRLAVVSAREFATRLSPRYQNTTDGVGRVTLEGVTVTLDRLWLPSYTFRATGRIGTANRVASGAYLTARTVGLPGPMVLNAGASEAQWDVSSRFRAVSNFGSNREDACERLVGNSRALPSARGPDTNCAAFPAWHGFYCVLGPTTGVSACF